MGSQLSAGLTGKWIQEKLDTVTARAYAVDAGLLYSPGKEFGEAMEGVKAGLTVRNLGSSLKFDQESFNLPPKRDRGSVLDRRMARGIGHHGLGRRAAQRWEAIDRGGTTELSTLSSSSCASSEFFHGPASGHLLGLLGGAIWGIGTVFNLVAANFTGVAISYAIGQSAPMVAALWGVFAWKEFQGAKPQAKTYLALMFLFYLLAILLVAKANTAT